MRLFKPVAHGRPIEKPVLARKAFELVAQEYLLRPERKNLVVLNAYPAGVMTYRVAEFPTALRPHTDI